MQIGFSYSFDFNLFIDVDELNTKTNLRNQNFRTIKYLGKKKTVIGNLNIQLGAYFYFRWTVSVAVKRWAKFKDLIMLDNVKITATGIDTEPEV